jgi:hypothetical protein
VSVRAAVLAQASRAQAFFTRQKIVAPVLRRSGRLAAAEPAFFFLNLAIGSGGSIASVSIALTLTQKFIFISNRLLARKLAQLRPQRERTGARRNTKYVVETCLCTLCSLEASSTAANAQVRHNTAQRDV